MGKVLKKVLGAHFILVLSLFDVVTSKSTGTVTGTAATGTFDTFWEFQDPNAGLISYLLGLRCQICNFLYSSSNPALCVEQCTPPVAAAAPVIACSAAKTEAASWVEIGGRLYTYHNKKSSWSDASTMCESLGMHLLIVDSPTELSSVLAAFTAMTGDNTWVGLKRVTTNPDSYAWVNGNPISVPFNNNGKECGIYDGSALTAALCNPVKPFVCEREVPC